MQYRSRWSRCTAGMLAAFVAIMSVSVSAQKADPKTAPAGETKTPKTKMLEAGSKLMQSTRPLEPIDIYLVGFHPMKHDPMQQMEAHHYCKQVNQDFAQCVLFDGNTRDANLNGIEYIISERLFNTLPDAEKKYWHPHNYEILSGQLVAPGIPAPAEKSLMKDKLNSYGKTWHVWNTGTAGKGGDKLPFGDAMLAWSFNQDGETSPEMIEQRDKRLRIDSAEKREERADLRPLAKPQIGENALRPYFQKGSATPSAR
jgi:hypothetical protein